MEKRTLILAWVVLLAVAALVVGTAIVRFKEGRCFVAGRRGGWTDCAHPAPPRA